jgi:raffinose/stachyose/melibiose transport system permease protein
MLRRDRLTAWAFLLPALLVYAAFVLWPIVQSVRFSLLRWNVVGETTFCGWDNYVWLLHDAVFWRALWHNLLLAAVSLAVQLPIAVGLAVLLSHVGRGRGLFRTAFFAPMVMPTVAIGLLWRFIYQPEVGPLAHLLGDASFDLGNVRTALPAIMIAICWRHIGFHTVLMMAGVEAIPDQQYEAARVDGAGEWRVFWHVTLPQLRPVIAVSALLSIIGSLRYFDLVKVMTNGGPAHASELVATYVFKTGIDSAQMGRGSALAVALLVVAFTVTLGVSVLLRRGRAAA